MRRAGLGCPSPAGMRLAVTGCLASGAVRHRDGRRRGAACGVARAPGWRPPGPAAALLAAAAMAGADAPLFALGVGDSREWGAADWVSDALPHAAYGPVTALTLAAISGRPRHRGHRGMR